MNLIELTFTKFTILYKTFREYGDIVFYSQKQNKNLAQKLRKIYAKTVKKVLCIYVAFQGS